jgi:hypothetical protein
VKFGYALLGGLNISVHRSAQRITQLLYHVLGVSHLNFYVMEPFQILDNTPIEDGGLFGSRSFTYDLNLKR